METSKTIIDLRKLLAERFPKVRMAAEDRKRSASVSTGIDALDSLLGGGLPRGEFTELVASANGSGSAEVIHELLRRVALDRQFLALIDGSGSFDPGAAEAAALTRLLWVRCEKVSEALKAADLLLRDRNFPMVVLDLKLNSAKELRGISASVWYRYARLLEQNQATVLVITPRQLVSGAACRAAVHSALGIEALTRSRAELVACLRFTLLRAAAEASEPTQSPLASGLAS
jgi:hypothetical protein